MFFLTPKQPVSKHESTWDPVTTWVVIGQYYISTRDSYRVSVFALCNNSNSNNRLVEGLLRSQGKLGRPVSCFSIARCWCNVSTLFCCTMVCLPVIDCTDWWSNPLLYLLLIFKLPPDHTCFFFFAGLHHYEHQFCQQPPQWSVLGQVDCFGPWQPVGVGRSICTVFIQVICGRPGGLFQYTEGEGIK